MTSVLKVLFTYLYYRTVSILLHKYIYYTDRLTNRTLWKTLPSIFIHKHYRCYTKCYSLYVQYITVVWCVNNGLPLIGTGILFLFLFISTLFCFVYLSLFNTLTMYSITKLSPVSKYSRPYSRMNETTVWVPFVCYQKTYLLTSLFSYQDFWRTKPCPMVGPTPRRYSIPESYVVTIIWRTEVFSNHGGFRDLIHIN